MHILQHLVDQHRRPDEGFEEPHNADYECGGVADVIDQCADEPQSIDGLGSATLVNDFGFLTYDGCVWFSGHFFLLLVGWYLLYIYTCFDQQCCLCNISEY